MATLIELQEALIAADESGNEDDAQFLADEIVRMQGNAPVPYGPGSGMDDLPQGYEPVQKEEPIFDPVEMIKNIPQSGAKLGWDMYEAVSSPIDTLNALGKVGYGYAGKAGVRGLDEYEKHADAVNKSYAERYGDIRRALKTLEQDPLGIAADASALATGVGATTRLLPGMGKAGKIMQDVGVAIDPINAAVNTTKAGARASIPSGLPSSMYQEAAKFPPASVKRPDRLAMTEAALNEGIMPTGGGIERVNNILSGLNEKIDTLIKGADESGVTIDRRALYSELSGLRRELLAGAAAPANKRKYTKIVGELDELMKEGPERLTPSRMQEFKTSTYNDINWKGKPSAKTETYSALARGARKAIENVTPEISLVNERYGPLADLRDRLPQIANRVDNHDFLSLRTLLAMTAGGQHGPGGSMLGLAAGVYDHPKVKAAAAIKLRELQNKGLLDIYLDNNTKNYLLRQFGVQSGELKGILDQESE